LNVRVLFFDSKRKTEEEEEEGEEIHIQHHIDSIVRTLCETSIDRNHRKLNSKKNISFY